MKLMFWVLASLLVVVMADYVVTRDATAACEVPHSITFWVFR